MVEAPPPAAEPSTDYGARWREEEARWAAEEAKRAKPAPLADDGDAWWKRAQREAEAREAEQIRLAALEEQRRRDEEDAARRRAEEAEARNRAWLDLELRWSGINEEQERRRREEEARRVAELAREEERRAEAGKCQTMMRDAAQKGRILFKVSSANLDPRSAPTLNELAKIAEACPNARIEIEGHTDSDGDEAMNKALSERRAKAIAEYLTRAGVPAERLAAIGYGESRPVAPNDSGANKAKNRRIDFKVVPN